MTRLNIFLILLLAGMLTFAHIGNAKATNSDMDETVALSPIPTPLPTSTPTPTPVPIGPPVTIVIPKISVNAPVVPVGTDFQGKMVMPDDWYTNAWYSGAGAAKPGEKGNAVIAGHVDTIFGTKGHFYRLAELVTGDEVIVNDDLGLEHHFVVTDKQTYLYDQVPLEAVFGPSQEKHLNLITCTGVYINGNYTERLVVFTKLIE